MKMIGRSDVLLSKCARFREGLFTDVQLQIGKSTLSAHRMVLAAYSDYFYSPLFSRGFIPYLQFVNFVLNSLNRLHMLNLFSFS